MSKSSFISFDTILSCGSDGEEAGDKEKKRQTVYLGELVALKNNCTLAAATAVSMFVRHQINPTAVELSLVYTGVVHSRLQ